jgi:hypothetical protein
LPIREKANSSLDVMDIDARNQESKVEPMRLSRSRQSQEKSRHKWRMQQCRLPKEPSSAWIFCAMPACDRVGYWLKSLAFINITKFPKRRGRRAAHRGQCRHVHIDKTRMTAVK